MAHNLIHFIINKYIKQKKKKKFSSWAKNNAEAVINKEMKDIQRDWKVRYISTEKQLTMFPDRRLDST